MFWDAPGSARSACATYRFFDLDNVPPLPRPFWIAVTALGLFGLFKLVELICAFAVSVLGGNRRPADVTAECYFAAVCAVVYLSPLLFVRYFDRYIATIVPIVCLFILAFTERARVSSSAAKIVSGTICAGFVLFGVLGTHDYLSWNRARWQAIADLERVEHASASTIDGGFEFNGSRSYDSNYKRRPGKSWWWVEDDRYQVTFGPVPGASELRRYSYTTYLPPGTGFVYVLRRSPPDEGGVSGRKPSDR